MKPSKVLVEPAYSMVPMNNEEIQDKDATSYNDIICKGLRALSNTYIVCLGIPLMLCKQEHYLLYEL